MQKDSLYRRAICSGFDVCLSSSLGSVPYPTTTIFKKQFKVLYVSWKNCYYWSIQTFLYYLSDYANVVVVFHSFKASSLGRVVHKSHSATLRIGYLITHQDLAQWNYYSAHQPYVTLIDQTTIEKIIIFLIMFAIEYLVYY